MSDNAVLANYKFNPWTDFGASAKRTSLANWRKPLAWDRAAAAAGERHRVFCASLADWLDDPEVPAEWLADLLALTAATPNLDWLLLTKRPELWRERMEEAVIAIAAPLTEEQACLHPPIHGLMAQDWLAGTPPPNVWIGTTAEDQRRADERIPALLSIPARVRFLSMEPLIEAVDLFRARRPVVPGTATICDFSARNTALGALDWVIVGGESGPRARSFDIAWARSIVSQCLEAGVAAFVKQLGARPVELRYATDFSRERSLCPLRLRDSHGGDHAEWPADLRVREFPPIR